MAIGSHIQAWRQLRKVSLATLAESANITQEELAAIEKEDFDPSVSIVEALAGGLCIPAAWLHYEPSAIKILLADPDEENNEWLETKSSDPVMAHIFAGSRHDRTLYALLTSLLQQGEPKLVRAAEVNLRSLLKQAQRATVPWQSRPPGHFEPPAD